MGTAPWGYYECGRCGRRFARGWSPAEASAEHERLFGFPEAEAADGFAEICGDCHPVLLAWWQELPAADREAMTRRARGL